jgi:predicted phage terminase large subunit-like protein
MGKKNMVVYVLPGIVNERMQFPDTLRRIAQMAQSLSPRRSANVIIEDVALQGGLHQELTRMGLQAHGWSPKRLDKRSRLNLVAHLIQSGRVLFPEHGAEALIQQLVGFGAERHDDLADACSMMLIKITEICGGTVDLKFLNMDGRQRETDST